MITDPIVFDEDHLPRQFRHRDAEADRTRCQRIYEFVASCTWGLRGCSWGGRGHMYSDDNWPMHVEAAVDLFNAMVNELESENFLLIVTRCEISIQNGSLPVG